MIRRIVVLSVLLLGFIGFSFAANDNISCMVNYTTEIDNNHSVREIKVNEEKPFICQDNKDTELSNIPLQIKNIDGSNNNILKYGDGNILGDLWYDNNLIKSQAKLIFPSIGEPGTLTLDINKKNKTIMIRFLGQEYFGEQEKVDFNGKSLYKISNLWGINPYIKFENDNYATRVYFSDTSKKYITNPTIKNKYNGLYMQVYNKSTKKITQKALYTFSSIAFNDSDIFGKLIFDIILDDNGSVSNTYTFYTNTRNIKVDINNPLNPVVTKK